MSKWNDYTDYYIDKIIKMFPEEAHESCLNQIESHIKEAGDFSDFHPSIKIHFEKHPESIRSYFAGCLYDKKRYFYEVEIRICKCGRCILCKQEKYDKYSVESYVSRILKMFPNETKENLVGLINEEYSKKGDKSKSHIALNIYSKMFDKYVKRFDSVHKNRTSNHDQYVNGLRELDNMDEESKRGFLDKFYV